MRFKSVEFQPSSLRPHKTALPYKHLYTKRLSSFFFIAFAQSYVRLRQCKLYDTNFKSIKPIKVSTGQSSKLVKLMYLDMSETKVQKFGLFTDGGMRNLLRKN